MWCVCCIVFRCCVHMVLPLLTYTQHTVCYIINAFTGTSAGTLVAYTYSTKTPQYSSFVQWLSAPLFTFSMSCQGFSWPKISGVKKKRLKVYCDIKAYWLSDSLCIHIVYFISFTVRGVYLCRYVTKHMVWLEPFTRAWKTVRIFLQVWRETTEKHVI